MVAIFIMVKGEDFDSLDSLSIFHKNGDSEYKTGFSRRTLTDKSKLGIRMSMMRLVSNIPINPYTMKIAFELGCSLEDIELAVLTGLDTYIKEGSRLAKVYAEAKNFLENKGIAEYFNFVTSTKFSV